MANKYLNWLIFGALAGLVLGLVAPWLISLLATKSGIAGITFATYDVSDSLKAVAVDPTTGVNPVATWAAGFVGVTIPDTWWIVALISAAGLGAAVAVTAWLYDLVLGKIVELVVPARYKLYSVMILAGVIVAIAIQNQYPKFEIASMVFTLLTGVLSVMIMQWVYKLTKMTLPV